MLVPDTTLDFVAYQLLELCNDKKVLEITVKFGHFQYGVHLIGTFNQNYQIEGFYSTLFMTSPFIVNIIILNSLIWTVAH